MSYVKTNRKATHEQFEDGTTVDGLRLDAALDQIVARHNRIKRGDIKTRFVRQMYTWGWEPPLEDAAAVNVEDQPATKLPWMRASNAVSVYGSPAPPDDYATRGENPWRIKGSDVTVIDPNVDPSFTIETDQYIWTNQIALTAPGVLTELFLLLATDAVYSNNFQYPNPPGAGLKSPATQITAQADYVSDIVLQLAVDSQLRYSDTTLSDTAVNAWSWRADAMKFKTYAAADGMLPASLNGVPDGVLIHLPGLNIPLPEYARLRLSMAIPYYDSATYDASTCWNDGTKMTPWARQVYNLSAVILEELR